MTPLLAEKPPEPVDKIREPARTAEDWAGGSAGPPPGPPEGSGILFRVDSLKQVSEGGPDPAPEGPVRFSLSTASTAPGASRLDASFTALGELRGNRDPGTWLQAAATLKRDAVRLRNSAFSRHADVLLSLADALTFTDPKGATEDSMAALESSFRLLSEPFVKESEEEDLLVELMTQGWNLAPSVDPADYPG